MDDDEMRRTIQTLAEPRPAPVGARDRIVGRVAAKRRRRLLGAGTATATLIGVVMVGVVHWSPDQQAVSPTTTDQGTTAPIDVLAGPYGFGVEMTVSFPDNRQLLSGFFRADGKKYPVSFYPNDGTDNDVQPDPLPLAAGVTVISSAKLRPDCAVPARPPDLILTSRRDNGTTRSDTFGTSNPGKFAASLKDWCATGIQATVSRSHGAAPGDPIGMVRVTLTIVNPGTKPVTVTSAAYDAGRAHWNPATVTVPPASQRELVITAIHSSCGARETPWRAGLLKSGGHPIEVTDGTQWC